MFNWVSSWVHSESIYNMIITDIIALHGGRWSVPPPLLSQQTSWQVLPQRNILGWQATFFSLQERHRAANIANIADLCKDVIAKFNIPQEKIKAVVQHNSVNVVTTVNILTEKHEWASVWCAEHLLNLVVRSALKKTTDYVQVCGCCKIPCRKF